MKNTRLAEEKESRFQYSRVIWGVVAFDLLVGVLLEGVAIAIHQQSPITGTDPVDAYWRRMRVADAFLVGTACASLLGAGIGLVLRHVRGWRVAGLLQRVGLGALALLWVSLLCELVTPVEGEVGAFVLFLAFVLIGLLAFLALRCVDYLRKWNAEEPDPESVEIGMAPEEMRTVTT